MTRDTLRDPRPGDRFVLRDSSYTLKCVRRTPSTVDLQCRVLRSDGLGRKRWLRYTDTMRLSTLAKIARPKGKP